MTALTFRVACLSLGILLSGCSSSMGDLLGGKDDAPTATPAAASADKGQTLEPNLAAADDAEPVAVLYNLVFKRNVTYVSYIFAGAIMLEVAFGGVTDGIWNGMNKGVSRGRGRRRGGTRGEGRQV